MLFFRGKCVTSIEEAERDPLSVHRLQLWHMDLNPYAGRFAQFRNLQSLDIGWAATDVIPADIAQLGKLRKLCILNVPLREFPLWICEMTTLRDLAVRGTEISYIPPEIASLVSLQKLDISNANIKELPTEIAHLRRLRNLAASANLLTSISDDIAGLRRLKRLNLVLNMFSQDERERLLAKYGRRSMFRSRSFNC